MTETQDGMERFLFWDSRECLEALEKKMSIFIYKAFHIKSCVSTYNVSCNCNCNVMRFSQDLLCMYEYAARNSKVEMDGDLRFLSLSWPPPLEIFIQPVRAAGFDLFGNSIKYCRQRLQLLG